MYFLNAFVEKVRQEKESFALAANISKEISDGEMNVFMQANINGTRFIYTNSYATPMEHLLTERDFSPTLVAFVMSDGKIYIVDDYIFSRDTGNYSMPELPENVEIFSPEKINRTIVYDIYKKYVDTLPTVALNEDEIKRCKDRARYEVLYGADIHREATLGLMNTEDIMRCLCGFRTFESMLIPQLERTKGNLIANKSFTVQKEFFKNNPDLITEPWERDLAKALVEASEEVRSVTVEFEYNGKTASERMAPKDLLRALSNKEYLASYMFLNKAGATAMIKNLGAANNGHSQERPLYCSDITQITYNRKELYVRKPAELELEEEMGYDV